MTLKDKEFLEAFEHLSFLSGYCYAQSGTDYSEWSGLLRSVEAIGAALRTNRSNREMEMMKLCHEQQDEIDDLNKENKELKCKISENHGGFVIQNNAGHKHWWQ